MRLARHQFADEDFQTAERYIRDSPASPAWRCLRCWFAAQSGDLDQANADLDWLARDRFARLPRDANWLPALFELSEAVFALRDKIRAAEIYELILPFQDQHICAMRGTVSWGSAHATLGKLASTAGYLDDATIHYQAALELERRWGARAWLVRTRARYADLLLRRARPGDHETALDLAREAIAQARVLQLSPDLIPAHVRHRAETPLEPS
jgi:tetratricopeptide (TPR) repeat protein